MSQEYRTLKDIAKYLGLHHTTISKGLRNHPDIKKETCELIQKTAKELDYHPSAVARSFKKNQTSIIGICVPMIENNFFARAICGAETVLEAEGYIIMVCQTHEDYEREVKATSALISNHVAGLLISPSERTENMDHLKSFERRGIPVVCFDRMIDQSGIDAVVVDDRKGAFDAVSHLIEMGYRRIAHLAGPSHVSVAKGRLDGYLDALRHHHLEVSEDLIIRGGLNHDSGAKNFKQLLESGHSPDAVFCVSSLVAAGVYREAEHRGMEIPTDIAVAGFGDIESCALLNPPMTTVRQSPGNLGAVAAEIVLSRIKEPNDNPAQIKKTFPAELVIRESTKR